MREDLVPRREDRLRPVAPEQLGEPPLPDAAGVAHGLEVALHDLGHPHVAGDQAHHLAVHLAAAPEPGGQDADALLVELADPLDGLGAGRRPAHVDLVRAVDDEADEPVAVEHRRREEEVGQVARAHVEVVEHDGVAGLENLRRILVQDVADEGGHGAQVPGAEVTLGDHPPAGVEEGRGEVAALADGLRVGGLAEGRPRFLGDRLERGPHHALGDRVYPGDHGRHDTTPVRRR